MSGWERTGYGTYLRRVTSARKPRRCGDCRRPLRVGQPYVEHRAVQWSEFSDHAYSITTCGAKTTDCAPTPPPDAEVAG